MSEPLVEVAAIAKHFPLGGKSFFARRHKAVLRAVDGVSLRIMPGETLGLVGESGCGKSTLGRMLLRLVEPTSGNLLFDGSEITHLKGAALRAVRRSMQIVLQDPYGALNPRMAVEDIIAEPLVIHGAKPGAETRAQVASMLEKVGLPKRALD